MKINLIICLLLFCAIIWAQELTPLSGMNSTVICNTKSRITYIYPDPNGWVDVCIGVITPNVGSLYHVSGSEYNLRNCEGAQAWMITGRYSGDAEYVVKINGADGMDRHYRVTRDTLPLCDLRPDGKINLLDFAILSRQWGGIQ